MGNREASSGNAGRWSPGRSGPLNPPHELPLRRTEAGRDEPLLLFIRRRPCGAGRITGLGELALEVPRGVGLRILLECEPNDDEVLRSGVKASRHQAGCRGLIIRVIPPVGTPT